MTTVCEILGMGGIKPDSFDPRRKTFVLFEDQSI